MRKILKLLIMSLIMLFVLSPCAAATGDEMTNAVVTPTTLDLVNSNTIVGGDDQFVVIDTPAMGFPTEGTYYANINTGDSNEDAANFTLNLTIPAGAQTLSFDWMFASNEYPDEGPEYNDTVLVEIISGDSSQNILFLPGNILVCVGNAWSLFSAPTDNIGYTGVTQMYTTNFDISSFAGSNILLSFSIEDVLDTSVDSAFFIDNLHIEIVEPEPEPEPEPLEAVTVSMQETGAPLAYLVLAVLLMLGGLVMHKRK